MKIIIISNFLKIIGFGEILAFSGCHDTSKDAKMKKLFINEK